MFNGARFGPFRSEHPSTWMFEGAYFGAFYLEHLDAFVRNVHSPGGPLFSLEWGGGGFQSSSLLSTISIEVFNAPDEECHTRNASLVVFYLDTQCACLMRIIVLCPGITKYFDCTHKKNRV